MKHALLTASLLAAVLAAPAVTAPPATAATAAKVCAQCVKAHMDHLAGDALRGRRCATEDEHAAARYIESELKKVGARPGFGQGGYLQAVSLSTPTELSPPAVTVSAGSAVLKWAQGGEMIASGESASLSGPVVRITAFDGVKPEFRDAVVFLDAPYNRKTASGLRAAGAKAVVAIAPQPFLDQWSQAAAATRPQIEVLGTGEPKAQPGAPTIMIKPQAAEALRALPAGARLDLAVAQGQPKLQTTYNVVGVIHGSAPNADHDAILLSAHYDHLGVRGGKTFHGADDDASGTSAVLEFARLLGRGPKPRRTVYFALFGCEESGGLGASYFRARPPGALNDLTANLEFEMIGLRDPKHPNELMLTGWDRSNLGPTLAAHGARLGPDYYPEQNFFQRSDNYQLALKGVVAQTVGGWPTPPTYHDASDDLAHIDLAFMDEAIGSMLGPVQWLTNSDFRPAWNPGKKP
ncbi:MAG: M28 family peptidase [Proteobacteria bacterium]|nr:M28 family peptidase [Pseudomonadota bacterium]